MYDPIFALHRTTLLRDMENGKMNYVKQMFRLSNDIKPNTTQIYGIPVPSLPTDAAKGKRLRKQLTAILS